MEKLLDGESTPNLESLHKVRLTALLNDLVEEGRLEAAQLLGVNYKTVAAALDSGVLTPRLSDALEKVLLSRQIEAFDEVREYVGELEGRLEAVEERGRNIPGEIEEAVKGEVERRMAEWVRSVEGAVSLEGEESRDAEDGGSSLARQLFRTTNPSVITMETQPGDEEVFGDAWPMVDAWRVLRERHSAEGKGVEWLEDEERLRELEIELIGEHGLTVPPDTDPWDSLSRRTQVRWRTQTLERVRRERVLALIRWWIRRIVTLGRWKD